MNEIKPKYVNGEPVCSAECEKHCFLSDVQQIMPGQPCIPALRRDRDQAMREVCSQRALHAPCFQNNTKGLLETAKLIAKQRGWNGLFEGGE